MNLLEVAKYIGINSSILTKILSYIVIGFLLLATQNTYGQDADQDGIVDANDLDDDNDGILDTDECGALIDVFISLENFETAGFVSDAAVNDPNCQIPGCNLNPRGGSVLIGDTATITCWNPTTGVVEGTKGAHPTPTGNALVFNAFISPTGPMDDSTCNGIGDQNGNGRFGEIAAISNIPVTVGTTYSVAIYAAEITNTDPFTDSYRFRFYIAGTNTLAGIPDFPLNNITQGNQNWQLNETDFTATATQNIDIVLIQTIERGNGSDIVLDAFSIIERVCSLDTDNDGILDVRDLDSDNDGCPDALEGNGGFEFNDLQPNQSLAGTVDTNGIPTLTNGGQQSDSNQNADVRSYACCLSDFDNDGVCDDIDFDDDNDGILDTEECQLPELLNFDINSFTLLPPFTEANNCTQGIWFNAAPLYSIGQPNDICFDPGATPGTITDYTTGSETTGTILGIQAGPGNDFISVLSFNQNLQANTNYQLSLAHMIWSRSDAPIESTRGIIQIVINGVVVNTYQGTPGLPFGAWELGTLNFNTGTITNTTIEIQIRRGPDASGNDYMLDDVILRQLDAVCTIDTDGDGITNDKDLDSDNDGCADALEGTLSLDFSSLNPDGSLNGAVDANGVPVIANGGQGTVSSTDANTRSTVCEDLCSRTVQNQDTNLGSGRTAIGSADPNWTVEWVSVANDFAFAPGNDGDVRAAYVSPRFVQTTNGTRWITSELLLDSRTRDDADGDGDINENNGPRTGPTGDAVRLVYETTITLPNTVIPASVSAVANISSDNTHRISVNGVSDSDTFIVDGFNNIRSTVFNSGWRPGINTIQIEVNSTGGPVALLVEEILVSYQENYEPITQANLNIVNCDDNATPSDGTDDILNIELNPTGNQPNGSYSVQIDGGLTITPAIGNYAQTTSFEITGITDTLTTYTITLTDNQDSDCEFIVQFDARSCSDQCTLDNANETILGCDGNGTPSDPSDDSFAISLNPQGLRLGANYTVSVDGGLSVTPTTASYGTTTNFTFTGLTDTDTTYTLTITDENDAACALPLSFQARTCSDQCTLDNANETILGCDGNGTPSDPSDDSFAISLNPQGLRLGANYTVSVDGGLNVTPTTASYGTTTNFTFTGLTDTDTTYTLTITDENDAACALPLSFQARTCSDQCTLDNANETILGCDGNGTPSDPSDDSFAISLNPQGLRLGANYTVSVDGGLSVTPTTASYGTTTNFTFTGLTDTDTTYTLTITDENDAACALPLSFQARTCSDQCTLDNANETILGCDGNGTPSDPSDDSFAISLNPQGLRLGANYTVSVDGGLSVTPTTASYGTTTNFTFTGLTDTDTTYTLTITDENDAACALPLSFQARTCSDQCTLDNANETILGCDGNGTPSDPSDDSFAISLNPQGLRLGANYTVSVDGGLNVTPTTASYGTTTNFTFTGLTDTDTTYTLTITDENDAACALPISFQARTCSDQCTLDNANETILGCDGNGTPSDPSDDSFAISLNPQGLRLGANYTVSVDGGLSVTPTTASYGTTTNFTFTGLTDTDTTYTLTITDENDAACALPLSFQARTCSDQCTLDNANETILGCDGNGTPSDPSDDSFAISLNPQGLRLGANYTVSVDGGLNVTPTTASYGTTTNFTFTGLTDTDTTYTLTITDENDAACALPLSFQARTCSDQCTLDNANETILGCDGNGTPSDPSDDSFAISLNPQGLRLGANYTVSVDGGLNVTPTTASYGTTTNFTFTGLTDTDTTYTLTITDENDAACALPISFQARTCSDQCNIDDFNLTIIGCNDNGTPYETQNEDDFIEFSLSVSGNNTGDLYFITYNGEGSVEPSSGTFNSTAQFRLSTGTADGITAHSVTITSANSDDCELTLPIDVLESCSTIPLPKVTNDLIDSNRIDLEILNISGIENFPENLVKIYNRWGAIVYEVRNYDNRENSFNGKANTKLIVSQDENLPNGVYFYVIEFKIGTDDYQKISGYLYKK
ncbi:gliding motility-associated C-terminal domain-containing protein [Maribacter sp. MJ134]|uniref:T9SS type B sorting domain-containing protein n=1 Tax=Maribacter sp. MJ134 TaxID=2496865 RepID=UPI000F81BE13|nr:gliding motility-associated C-terminal domain-containing protein [Maribacter sp. MJ134]AZQ57490.1 gliding motility-associated C-terminal domain-containing protein [Maribacter sp. MJ134]